jgi:hypothetical protein
MFADEPRRQGDREEHGVLFSSVSPVSPMFADEPRRQGDREEQGAFVGHKDASHQHTNTNPLRLLRALCVLRGYPFLPTQEVLCHKGAKARRRTKKISLRLLRALCVLRGYSFLPTQEVLCHKGAKARRRTKKISPRLLRALCVLRGNPFLPTQEAGHKGLQQLPMPVNSISH